jgi:hypothetical protein
MPQQGQPYALHDFLGRFAIQAVPARHMPYEWRQVLDEHIQGRPITRSGGDQARRITFFTPQPVPRNLGAGLLARCLVGHHPTSILAHRQQKSSPACGPGGRIQLHGLVRANYFHTDDS